MDITIGFAMEKYTIIPSMVQVDECLGQNVSQESIATLLAPLWADWLVGGWVGWS